MNNGEQAKVILEENCNVRRTLDYYAHKAFNSKQRPNKIVSQWGAQMDTMCGYLQRASRKYIYKDVSKSFRTVLVKRSLLTLDVKFLHHLQSTPLLDEYSGPSVSAMLGSIPGSPF